MPPCLSSFRRRFFSSYPGSYGKDRVLTRKQSALQVWKKRCHNRPVAKAEIAPRWIKKMEVIQKTEEEQ
jgi:hypothetical protein